MSGSTPTPNQQVVPRPRSSAGRAGSLIQWDRDTMTDTTDTTDTTTKELPKAYRPADFEGAIYERWLAADVFAPDGAGSQADPDAEPFTIIQPPPEYHRVAASRSRPADRGRGPDDPARPDARSADALPAGPRSCLDRRPVRPRPDHRRGRRNPPIPGPRAVPRADVAVHQRDPRGHARPAAAGRWIVRLVTSQVHDGRFLEPRRP